MIGRISSFHNYQSVQNDLRRQENKIAHNQAQLASGKRLQSAGDDPLATHYIQNIDQQSVQTKQYMDSIVLVRNRLENQEVVISNAEQFADQAKRSVMEMINGSLSPEDRQAKARELQEVANNFLDLANTQDESGNYIFAGTKPRNQPFFKDNAGSVSYVGDDYQRKMRISNTMEIAASDPGSKLFMNIKNPFGDFDPKYHLQDASDLLLERATNSNENDQSTYKVTFVDMGNSNFGYQLEKNGNVVHAGDFDASKGIQYDGVSIQLRGQITPGDSITLEPKDHFSIFEVFQKVDKYSNAAVTDSSATAELQQATEEFHTAFIHLNKARTDLGARLGTLDIQEQQHEDFNLALTKSKSNFEDLDYAKAIIDFNENSRALQASQQAFGKTKDLSLFNYI